MKNILGKIKELEGLYVVASSLGVFHIPYQLGAEVFNGYQVCFDVNELEYATNIDIIKDIF